MYIIAIEIILFNYNITNIHAYVHHTYIRTYIHTCTYAYIHMNINVQTHIHIDRHTYLHKCHSLLSLDKLASNLSLLGELATCKLKKCLLLLLLFIKFISSF